MAEPQLSVRSSRARDLAHRLAQRENRTVAEIVERALEAYETRETGREPASAFYKRLRETGSDAGELNRILDEARKPHGGIDL